MAVYLGEYGCVSLKRNSLDELIEGDVKVSDVNTTADRFSFAYRHGALITGDFVEIKTTDGTPLDFIAPNGWPSNPPNLPPWTPPATTEDYKNAEVIFRYGQLNVDYQNADITSHLGNSLEDDYENGFTSPEFDPGTADYDNADVQPRGRLGFLTQYKDGLFFLHVDEVDAIRLYNTFDEAIAGERKGRIELLDAGRTIPISIRVRNNAERILGQVINFEVNTERDSVDVSSLSDEFRRTCSGLISGSGRIECFFEYERKDCDPMFTGDAGAYEMPVYMNQLIVRTQVGSEFYCKLTLISRGAKPYGDRTDDDDEVWYEFEARITNVAMSFEATQPIRSTIDFVATGPIRLRTRFDTNYLLQEQGAGARIRQERNQDGFLTVEENE